MDNEITNDTDEISLIDLFAVLLRHKALIISVTVTAALAVVIFSIVSLALPPDISPLPNEYTPSAHMLINDSSASGSGGLSAMINSSGLGSLASLAGVSTSSQSYSSLAVYLAGTNLFLDTIVDKFGFIELWQIKKSPRAESRKMLKNLLTASFDEKTAVFTISFTDIDPVFAQSVVNFAVDYMENRFLEMGLDKNKLEKRNMEENLASSYDEIIRLQKKIQELESSVSNGYTAASIPAIMLDTSMLKLELAAQQEVYTQIKTQYELLKITMASETPVFQILERAEVPDQKSKPSRGMLCIIVTFAAFFLSVFLAFLLNAVDNIKKDPEAMAKLSAGKRRKES
ncbi:GNVR domain-containing protein [Treponema brennaborense]|uniref:Lipopolysaccharide biosynthesis protein n=1 Tax=Treponema brennaborense (strain DSM 12168 / CIP 105900 / DD5/3) TaxID=906968 RepID=F4LJH0_TREBD|nr:GNVR domain-containing protein [Treponema brennaborense]AEE16365.1 lipopolysaccharide biosynthesis protein [Treponema brennaborense DSM 12168]